MESGVAEAVARGLSTLNPHSTRSVIWHGGEPLVTGIERFQQLVQPFNKLLDNGGVVHEIQTNGTLIDNAWCDFFAKHQFRVGVSIDGPSWANGNRQDWNGSPSFDRAKRGIECLRRNKIAFSAIAVVTKNTIASAKDLHSFFSTLGCSILGINIEEKEGVNVPGQILTINEVVTFWEQLFLCWEAEPSLKIREFERAFRFLKNTVHSHDTPSTAWSIDLFPTIAWNGNTSVLSPELAEATSDHYGHFVVGNVLQEPLEKLLLRSRSQNYVVEFLDGVKKCSTDCDYFEFCRGGQASNKFFETGSFAVTETEYCRNSKIRLIDSIIGRI